MFYFLRPRSQKFHCYTPKYNARHCYSKSRVRKKKPTPLNYHGKFPCDFTLGGLLEHYNAPVHMWFASKYTFRYRFRCRREMFKDDYKLDIICHHNMDVNATRTTLRFSIYFETSFYLYEINLKVLTHSGADRVLRKCQ